MKNLLSAVFLVASSISTSAWAEISYSEYSKIKTGGSHIAKYLGALDVCLTVGDPSFYNSSSIYSASIVGLELSKYQSARNIKIKENLINSLDASGMDFDKLSEIDDAIKSDIEASKETFSNSIAVAMSDDSDSVISVIGFCTAMLTAVGDFAKLKSSSWQSPVEVMDAYNSKNPINE